MKALGIDIGTTAIKIVVFDLDTNDILVKDTHPTATMDVQYLQDPDAMVAIVDNMIGRIEDSYDCIGITGQVHGILYIDNKGKAVSPFYTWMDTRASEHNCYYQKTFASLSGCVLPPGYGILTHYINLEQHLVSPNAVAFTGIIEYVASHLIGKTLTRGDASSLATLGCFDPLTNTFSAGVRDFCHASDFPLADVAQPLAIAGTTKKHVPVAYPVGDNQCGVIALLSDRRDSALISVGTSGQFSVISHNPACPPNMELRPYPLGGYLYVGATLSAGKSVELLMRMFQQAGEKLYGKRLDDERVYDTMIQQALACDHSLVADTTLFGTRMKPERTGALTHLYHGNLTMGHFTRAFVDGLVDELVDFSRCLDGTSHPLKRYILTGTAVAKNPLVIERFKQIADKEIIQIKGEYSTAVGAAFVGALSANIIDIEQYYDMSTRYRNAAGKAICSN